MNGPRAASALVGGAILVLGAACSRQPALPGVLHLVPDGVEELPLVVGNVSRMGFVSSAGSTHRVGFTVPQDVPRLWLACATCADTAGTAHTAVCRAVVRDGHGRSRTVFQRSVNGTGWAEVTVDLGPYAGKSVDLLLRSDPGGSTQDADVLWATPIVLDRTQDRPNVLLICIDSLRADHLGCYGYHRNTSPTIDSLASQGCLFTRAIAQSSWTLPSHASLLTSLYAKSHGVSSVFQALGATALTLAEDLRTGGYVTVAVISGGPLSADHGLDQGFDVYDTGCWEYSHTHDATNECTHARASAWLRHCRNSPFFLFTHYWDVHYDYLPPAPYDTLFDPAYGGDFDSRGVISERLRPTDLSTSDVNHLVALYDGEIAHTDRYVGMLLAELEAARLSDNTIVVLTSDHGDELFDHGTTGHGHTLYQELVRVPLIWVDPSRPPYRARVQDMVQLVDVPPAILERVDLAVPDVMQGESFLPLIAGRSGHSGGAFSEVTTQDGLRHELLAVLMGNAKIVLSPAGHTGDVLAFNLAADPSERSPQRPEAMASGEALRKAAVGFVSESDGARVEIRLAGGDASGRRDVIVRTRPAHLEGAREEDLESGDSLRQSIDSTSAVLHLTCFGGDPDGVSFQLTPAGAPFTVDVKVRNTPLEPEQIVLGAVQSPADALPFKTRANDPRLRGRPQVSERPGSEPKAYVWAVDRRQTSAVPIQLDEVSAHRLRALGYLW